jgi:hypothetical protein
MFGAAHHFVNGVSVKKIQADDFAVRPQTTATTAAGSNAGSSLAAAARRAA